MFELRVCKRGCRQRSLLSGWGASGLSSFAEQSSQDSRLDPLCLDTVPCQGSSFWGWQLSAAGSTGALLSADSKPLAVRPCQEFIIFKQDLISLLSLITKKEEEEHRDWFDLNGTKIQISNKTTEIWWCQQIKLVNVSKWCMCDWHRWFRATDFFCSFVSKWQAVV